MHAFNSILYPILYFGIIGAGGVFAGSNPAYKALELRRLLSIAEPKFFITEAGLWNDGSPVIATTTSRINIFILGADTAGIDANGCKVWSDLIQHDEEDWLRINDMKKAKSTVAVLQSTSGTTGLPKVAACSHYALVASGVAMRESDIRPYEVSRLISLPLFHSFGASFVHISAFRYGEPTYIMRKFDVEGFSNLVQRFGITEIAVVPAMLASIVNQRTSPLVLKSLRHIWCAGMSLPLETSKSMYELLHNDADISQVWGMTEFGRITSSAQGDKDDDGSAGRLLPNTELRYVVASSRNATVAHSQAKS